MAVHQLTRPQARRIAIRAQALTARRPTDLLDLVRQVTLLQIDPTAAVAPNVHLVAWSRLGRRYDTAALTAALERRELIEYRATLRPADDMGLHAADWVQWREGELTGWRAGVRKWVLDNDSCRRDILARLGADGPLPSRELPDTCVRPWRSTGWTNNRNITQLLEMLVLRGEVAVAGRAGQERLWDLAERVYPPAPELELAESLRRRNERRLHALGIARSRGPSCPVEPLDVGQAGEPAEVEGVRGQWQVDPAYLDPATDGEFEPRTALLSPFDRVLHDRKRMAEIFEFDYHLEMYHPKAKRRWGYFALPILSGDRLVGKLDATADRAAGVLRVDAVHQDVPFNRAMTDAVDREIADLARWLAVPVRRDDRTPIAP